MQDVFSYSHEAVGSCYFSNVPIASIFKKYDAILTLITKLLSQLPSFVSKKDLYASRRYRIKTLKK